MLSFLCREFLTAIGTSVQFALIAKSSCPGGSGTLLTVLATSFAKMPERAFWLLLTLLGRSWYMLVIMKYPSLAVSAAWTVCAVLVFVGGMLALKLADAYEQRDALKVEVGAKTEEVESLRESLSETEEGKKQVEEAKKQSDATAAANGRRASTAEADAAAKAAALASTNAQLSSTNAQLSKVQTQLAGAQRCVTLFNSTKPKIESFKIAIGNQNDSANNDMYVLASMYTAQANDLWQQIWPTMDRIATGYCY